MLTTLIAALSLAVPYLPQTEALCGGAAAAMVFRYWGDAHAGVEQFAPLVDRQAGGIADDVLVGAIEARGWRALRFEGSLGRLEEEIREGRPIMILVADGGSRYHYLLVTGIEPGAVIVHDPTWGPSRRISHDQLLQAWQPTGFWSLLILPPVKSAAMGAGGSSVSHTPPPRSTRLTERVEPTSQCGLLLDRAVEEARHRPLAAAYEIIDAVRSQCPAEAGPLREMAAVRFAEKRWRDAENLAARATATDPRDEYAWEVLASSRFVQDDLPGALAAWNRVGRPLIDLVEIEGLARGRFQTVATAIGLWPNTLLTESAFRLAQRRLQALPGNADSRLSFAPEPDGYVTIKASVVERDGTPQGLVPWTASALKAAIGREAGVALPGLTGQGEVWSAGWRWWSGRPRVSFGFSAPRAGRAGGVWQVHASWESQQYAAPVTESRLNGSLAFSDWLTGDVRYSVSGGLDAWRGISSGRRTIFVGGSLERRWHEDRWTLAGGATSWIHPSGGSAFHALALRGGFRSSREASGWIYRANAGVSRVSDGAPLAIWPRAGEGHAGGAPEAPEAPETLMRAHPLLHDGVIDAAGSVIFGRTVLDAHGEVQRWLMSAGPARLGVAGFADAGRALRRDAAGLPRVTHFDIGTGLRLRIPGSAGTLRVDIARGMRDDADALTVGWQF